MAKKGVALICLILMPVFFLSPLCFGASCPAKNQINKIVVKHSVTVVKDGPSGPYRQLSSVEGETEILVGGDGYIIPTGEEWGRIERKIQYSTQDCTCESKTYKAEATFLAGGACNNGKLTLNINESYEGGNIPVTCKCPGKTPPEFTYNQLIFPSGVTFPIEIPYQNGAKVTQPASCTGCQGTYSWTLEFSRVEDLPLVPLIPSILPLLLNN